MRGDTPEGLVTFNIMEPASTNYWCRGHDLDPTLAWVFPVGGELDSISPKGFTVHCLSVTEDRILQVCSEHEISVPPASQRPEVFSLPVGMPVNIWKRLQVFADSPESPDPLSVEQILDLLVPAWLDPHEGDIRHRPSVRTRHRAIRKSMEIITEAHPTKLTTRFLLEECHASRRTLEYAFQERFSMSPAAFLKRIRLVSARAELRRADKRLNSVTAIASNFGFDHTAQFASDYRTQFGELPSITLGRFAQT